MLCLPQHLSVWHGSHGFCPYLQIERKTLSSSVGSSSRASNWTPNPVPGSAHRIHTVSHDKSRIHFLSSPLDLSALSWHPCGYPGRPYSKRVSLFIVHPQQSYYSAAHGLCSHSLTCGRTMDCAVSCAVNLRWASFEPLVVCGHTNIDNSW